MKRPDRQFVELFTPKLITVLREGYGRVQLRADLVAGLTVAIVALPLSMALAIASGVEPARGLYAAIIGGFLISALGGSRHQIGGPAGAFIVLVAGTVAVHGVDGMLLATLMAGVIMIIVGFLRLGTYIRYIPYPVTVGFTAGIAAIIFASQLRDLLGLHVQGAEPAAFIPRLQTLFEARLTVTPTAVMVATGTVLVIGILRRFRPRWPHLLIAVTAASVVAALLHLQIETIGTRFGGLPDRLPLPSLPPVSWQLLGALLPTALSFALLGAIESLMSAVVADSMTGRRHRSNCELVAQGIANIASALFGGLCVTGTIARTATNVRSGAHGPVAGMAHALILLVFMLVAARFAAYIPLAALAGLLATVAWSMAEKRAIGTLLRGSRGEALVLLVTFGLTLFRNLMEGIVVGFAISAMVILHRMSRSVQVKGIGVGAQEDRPDSAQDVSDATSGLVVDRDTIVCRISGAFFFGAAASVASVLDQIAERPRNYVLDFSAVPLIDSTAVIAIAGFVRKQQRQHVRVFITGATGAVHRELRAHGVDGPAVLWRDDVAAALAECHSDYSL